MRGRICLIEGAHSRACRVCDRCTVGACGGV